MKDINKALMNAAKDGDEKELQALLLSLGCDPVSRSGDGRTALMWAAWSGRASCAELLLPVSDALAKSNAGMTASELEKFAGNAQLVGLIDVYTLPLGEMSMLGFLVGLEVHCAKKSLRV